MIAFEAEHRFSTDGDGTIIDITGELSSAVDESGVATGQLTVIVPGSTGAVTTIEFEPGLLEDLPEFFEKIIPSGIRYRHDETWGDGNGYSHVRASLLGGSLVVPVSEKRLTLGTWQQIVLVDFDNRPRSRQIVLQIMGE